MGSLDELRARLGQIDRELLALVAERQKVALALHNLISSQFPRDSLYMVGFSAYARELKAHELPQLHWDEYMLGTNIQHALQIAERLLARHQGVPIAAAVARKSRRLVLSLSMVVLRAYWIERTLTLRNQKTLPWSWSTRRPVFARP